jgi:hypothetical protein
MLLKRIRLLHHAPGQRLGRFVINLETAELLPTSLWQLPKFDGTRTS